jgi:hypothetical protein
VGGLRKIVKYKRLKGVDLYKMSDDYSDSQLDAINEISSLSESQNEGNIHSEI